tara:strand:- start:514 stop:903 length:390 start_codon:yes stop_codon:yes gene_type:complete
MSTLITVSFSLCFLALTGWTITTYFVKEDSQKDIKDELKNLFNNFKMFFISIKNLILILAKQSFSSDSSEINPTKSNKLNENPLSLVEAGKEVESPSLKVSVEEDDDTALSSFSAEVIEVIKEEEEKVA